MTEIMRCTKLHSKYDEFLVDWPRRREVYDREDGI